MQTIFYAWAIKRETGTSVQRTRSESGAAATGLFPELLPAVNINFLLLFFLMLYDINKVNLETTDYLYSNTNLWKSLPQDLSRTDSPVLFFKDCQVVLPQTCWQAKRAIGRITVFFPRCKLKGRRCSSPAAQRCTTSVISCWCDCSRRWDVCQMLQKPNSL